MAVSVNQQVGVIEDPASARALLQLLQAMQKDLAALKVQLDSHVHSALGAAPTTVTPTQNTVA